MPNQPTGYVRPRREKTLEAASPPNDRSAAPAAPTRRRAPKAYRVTIQPAPPDEAVAREVLRWLAARARPR
jgi:hypothetical protein